MFTGFRNIEDNTPTEQASVRAPAGTPCAPWWLAMAMGTPRVAVPQHGASGAPWAPCGHSGQQPAVFVNDVAVGVNKQTCP